MLQSQKSRCFNPKKASGSYNSFTEGTPNPHAYSQAHAADAAAWITRGGWPSWIDLPPDDAQILIQGYLEALSEKDFPLVGGRRRAPQRLANFLRAYSTLVAQPTPLSTVGKRLSEEGIDVGPDYPGLYHSFAQQMFIVEDQPAWNPRLRSRTRLVANPKRHLTDPSLAAAALNLNTEGLLEDAETLGLLFESLVVHDLRIYAQPQRGQVMHYRSHDAVSEMDAVVEFPNRRWIGIEIKLGLDRATQAAPKLRQAASVSTVAPQMLLVITPGGPVAELADGVWHVPLALLGP